MHAIFGLGSVDGSEKQQPPFTVAPLPNAAVDMANLDSISPRRGVDAAMVAVAVDRDKNSQHAVRWALENLRLKEKVIVLVHVTTNQHNLHTYDREGISSTHSEMQTLFLPFRSICARKGVRTKEVILHDPDVGVTLSGFLKAHSIKNIVLGASSRGAIVRAFKNVDVPTTVGKLAPDFCSVHAVSKGKAQKIKSSIDPIAPATALPPHLSPGVHREGSIREYQQNSPSERSIASSAPSPAYSTTSSNDSRHLFPWEKRHGSNHPTPPESTNISYESPRVSLDYIIGNSQFRYAVTQPNRLLAEAKAHRLAMEGSPNPSSIWSSTNQSDRHSYYPSDISYEHLDGARTSDASRCSTSSLAELEDELKRVKLELKQITEKYNAECQEAITTREKGKDITHKRSDESSTNLAETMAIVEREKQNSRAAMEILQKAQMLADLESEKRKQAERKFEAEFEKKQKVMDALAHSLARCRRYSAEEIETATNYFRCEKIGEGSYGPVYRAKIDHTPVAIKVLKSDMPDGLKQFQQEVEVLSRMRHPNMVLLVGACPEYASLVYEYMEQGSLEDRLFCKDGTAPLSWQTRFSIAAEIATALNFLHQTRPQPLVHRDLKPANILLDRNCVSKISDVGLSRLIPPSADDKITQYRMTAAAGTFCYIDPEYQQTGLLGTKSDVYSLGIILLQIVTAKPPMGLTYLVKTAIEKGKFGEIVDERIRDWPIEETLELAKLGLSCSELRRRDRPSLDSEVLPELERLRDFAARMKPERRYYFTYAENRNFEGSEER